MTPDRVARTIVDVIRRGRSPEVYVPAWTRWGELFRIVTPSLYHFVLAQAVKRR